MNTTGSLEQRERCYGAKWALDEQTIFQIMVKRNASLGQWAAEEMQLPAAERSHYVQAVIDAGLVGRGEDPVFEKIRGDFGARMLACPDGVILTKMKKLFDEAAETVRKKT